MLTLVVSASDSLATATPDTLWLRHLTAQNAIAAIDLRCRRESRDPTPQEDRAYSDAEATSESCIAELRRRVQSVIGNVPVGDLAGELL